MHRLIKRFIIFYFFSRVLICNRNILERVMHICIFKCHVKSRGVKIACGQTCLGTIGLLLKVRR